MGEFMEMAPENCWGFWGCGREPGGRKAHELGVCPATCDSSLDGVNRGKNGGRCCWKVAGSLCNGEVQGTIAFKFMNCTACEFLEKVLKEEGSNFSFLSD